MELFIKSGETNSIVCISGIINIIIQIECHIQCIELTKCMLINIKSIHYES